MLHSAGPVRLRSTTWWRRLKALVRLYHNHQRHRRHLRVRHFYWYLIPWAARQFAVPPKFQLSMDLTVAAVPSFIKFHCMVRSHSRPCLAQVSWNVPRTNTNSADRSHSQWRTAKVLKLLSQSLLAFPKMLSLLILLSCLFVNVSPQITEAVCQSSLSWVSVIY